MTCIAGIAQNGRVYIGGDSAGVGGGMELTIRSDPKVFKIGPYVMGFTSSFRMGQLLNFRFEAPVHPEGMSDYQFMVTHFIDAVRKAFKDGGYLMMANNQEVGGSFLVGYRGTLYTIFSDFQVGIPTDGFAACGCGEPYALGSLFATQDIHDPERRIARALESASYFSGGVAPPFNLVVLEPNEPEPVATKKVTRTRKKK